MRFLEIFGNALMNLNVSYRIAVWHTSFVGVCRGAHLGLCYGPIGR